MNGKTARLIRKLAESVHGDEKPRAPEFQKLENYWKSVWKKNLNSKERFQTRKFLEEKISQAQ